MITNQQAVKYFLPDTIANWMVSSGIQSASGGVYAWYDIKNEKYSYLYSEITGYAITAFLYLYKLYDSAMYLERAERAAIWIIKTAMSDCGGIKTRLFINDEEADKDVSFAGGNIFSFDTGIVLYGVANLYKETGNAVYLEAAKKMADFLVDKMQNPDGSFSAIYNEKEISLPDSFEKWSTQRGSFHSKMALGLIKIFEITNDEKYRKSAIKICEFALTKMDKTGRFITDEKTKTTHLHPHCYTIEGLLFTGRTFGIKKFCLAAEIATDWALSRVSNSGINDIFYPETDSFGHFQRSDILAQVLRAGVLFGREEGIDDLVNVLLDYRCNSDKDGVKGGIFYSKKDEHVNSWCAMFAFQALALFYDKNLVPPKGHRLDLLI